MTIPDEEIFFEIRTAWLDAVNSLETSKKHEPTYDEVKQLKEIDRVTTLYEKVYLTVKSVE